MSSPVLKDGKVFQICLRKCFKVTEKNYSMLKVNISVIPANYLHLKKSEMGFIYSALKIIGCL